MQMVHKPTFQLGPEYKYPWLIGMWRLLAQKSQLGPSPRPRRSLTLTVALEAAQGYLINGRKHFELPVSAATTLHSPSLFPILAQPFPAGSIANFTFERGLQLNPVGVLMSLSPPTSISVHLLDLEIPNAKVVNCVSSREISNKFFPMRFCICAYIYFSAHSQCLGSSPAPNLIKLMLQVNSPCIPPGETLYILHRL